MSPFDCRPTKAPEPDYDDPKEVYAFFGLASYNAQVLERSLVNFAAVLKTANTPGITREMVDDLYDALEPKTFGQLLRVARTTGALLPELEAELERALAERNQLTHHFFWDHAEDFMSNPGRRTMIDRLRPLIELFSSVDKQLESITLDAMRRNGITENVLDKEYAELLQRAETRYSHGAT
jgi:hypothetical protein